MSEIPAEAIKIKGDLKVIIQRLATVMDPIGSSRKSVSIKYGLRTADHGLRTGYKTRTKYKMRTAD